MRPLLSVLIPTFNRAIFLEGLLIDLERQLCAQEAALGVEILISDNASTDNTSQVLQKFYARNPAWRIIQHSVNLGPDANMIHLIVESQGSYRWIIGDDDRPFPGLIRHLLKLLRGDSPSLIYLPSLWAPDISAIHPEPINSLSCRQSSSLNCARELHIWTTFLSSWIFSADQLFAGLSTIQSISSGQGSFFVQLGWILPLLTCPQSRIFILDQPCILATSGNTGGYAILSSFLVNYPRLVISHTPGFIRMRLALIGRPLKYYIPKLILSVRLGEMYRDAGQVAGLFSHCVKLLWYYPSFWLLCIPSFFIPLKVVRFLRFSIGQLKRKSQRIKRRN